MSKRTIDEKLADLLIESFQSVQEKDELRKQLTKLFKRFREVIEMEMIRSEQRQDLRVFSVECDIAQHKRNDYDL